MTISGATPEQVEQRDHLGRIVDLAREALGVCDRCGEYLLAAKLAEAQDLAMSRLRQLDDALAASRLAGHPTTWATLEIQRL